MGPTAAATTLATAREPPGAGAETAEKREHRQRAAQQWRLWGGPVCVTNI